MEGLKPRVEDEQISLAHPRERDMGEFQDVVSRYLPSFYRRAYRYVGDPHDAEDAVQDALLSAYNHLDQFKGTAKMATWLTTIVTNSALTQLRRRPRNPHLSLDERLDGEQSESLSDRLADPGPDPEHDYAGSEQRHFFMQVISELSPPLRDAFLLRYSDGLNLSEAAQALGISEGRIKARLWRARTKLKQIARTRRSGA
jgi:RNA polymerase sigma-70 factor (ECF subfamily)